VDERLPSPAIVPEEPSRPVGVHYRERTIVTFPVQEQELDVLARGYASPAFNVFTLCVGVVLALLPLIVTGALVGQALPIATAALVGTLFGMLLAAGYAWRDWRQARSIHARIKSSGS